MTNVFRRLANCGAPHHAAACAVFSAAILSASLLTPSAQAQDVEPSPQTPLDRQIARLDLAISGAGQFSTSINGTNYLDQNVNLKPSNTVGALVTVRYIKSPLIGAEFNFSYARYTDNFTVTSGPNTPKGSAPFALGVQTNADEYTVGYVAHTRGMHFGVTPFASIGAGTIAFKPTAGGGQGYLEQARAAYYYSVGADTPLYANHFGLRASFRQEIYLAPDYETNYYTVLKRSITSEPTFGFFIKF
jgi:hypothetical protein